MLIKPKGSPFYIFRHYATFSERKNIQKIQVFFQKNVLRFLTLRDSADFRRSRLLFLPSLFFVMTHMTTQGPTIVS